jgi:hypothetical protein
MAEERRGQAVPSQGNDSPAPRREPVTVGAGRPSQGPSQGAGQGGNGSAAQQPPARGARPAPTYEDDELDVPDFLK